MVTHSLNTLTLFGQMSSSSLPWILGMIIVVAVIFFMFIMLLARRYKRCPSNRLLVIYGRTGRGSASKTIHGGAAFV